MSTSRWALRLFCIIVLGTFVLITIQPGAAQDGGQPGPSEPLEATAVAEPVSAGTTPEGLSPVEWESIQAQIAASEAGPASPNADAPSSLLPNYLVAPLIQVVSSDGAAEDYFAYSVDIDGEQMIVGSPYSDISGKSNQGAAYLFQRNRNNPDQWGQTAKIVVSAGLAGDLFGSDVSISGDIVAVGASGVDLTGGGIGAAYIFYRNSGGMNTWGNVRKITGGGVDSRSFGHALDLSSDKLVVGDPNYVLGGNAVGQAYIFYMNQGGVNNWGQVQWLGNMNPADGDDFGAAVAIDGDLCAIGSPYRDENGVTDGGAVYMFSRNSGGADAWSQTYEMSAREHSYVYANDRFGSSVALDRGVLVVGAPWKTTAESPSGGAVLVFTSSSYVDEWDLQAILAPPTGFDFSGYGYTVDKDGQFIVVGAYNWGSVGNLTGTALVYQQNRGSVDAWGLVQQVTAVNGANGDKFGSEVAISNDRIAIGAYGDNIASNTNQGSVHVFALQAQDWYISKTLSPFTTNIQSVAVYGEWLAVGLPFQTVSGHSNQGAVYLYRRNQGGAEGWELYKQLAMSDGIASDWFGFSVALYDDILAVGVPWRDTGNTNNGLVVIYKRDQDGLDQWGEWKRYYLAEDGYLFGNAVALHQDLLAIGAPGADISGKANQGIVWMCYIISGGCDWKPSIVASDGVANDSFGYPLSIDNDILAVGSESGGGAVYLHYRNLNGSDQWGRIKKLSGASGENYGASIAVSDELIAVGAPDYDGTYTDQGRVIIYGKNKDGADLWGVLITITDATANNNHHFGRSVALYYDRLLVGAPGCSISGDGCVSAFRRNHAGMNQWGRYDRILGPYGSFIGSALAIDSTTAVAAGSLEAEVLAFRANYWMLARTAAPLEVSESGGLGYSVALAGDMLVAGAPDEAFGTGAAYLFERNRQAPDSWTLVKRLIATGGASQERFGHSISISGNWIAVGAVKATTWEPSAVYLFERNTGGAGNWGQFKRITCPGGSTCAFGYSIALSGATLVVGAPTNPAVYIFYKDQGGVNNWGLKKTITSTDWHFGFDVALDNDTLAVGAPEADVDGYNNQGAAYIFSRNQNGVDNWGQVQKLVPADVSNCSVTCSFGRSVALHQDVAVIGAIQAMAGNGAAYIYYRNLGGPNAWGKLKRITASDGDANDWFGSNVAVYGDHILVSAHLNDIFTCADQGAVYWFWRNYNGADSWSQHSRILLPDGKADEEFGAGLALWNDILVIGAMEFSTFSDGVGAAHIFRLMLPRELFLPLVRR